MKIFITGTESFVGKELISQCDKSGGIELFGCDYQQPSDKRFHQADIRLKNISDIIPENMDAIVHLAALSTDKLCRNNVYNCFSVNVLGTLNLIDAVRLKQAKQFIFASSEWVYGESNSEEPRDEDFPIDIRKLGSEYALSKLVSENNLHQAYKQGFCDITILRFGIIYGPRLSNWSAVESLFNDVKIKDTVTVGSLQTARCFIHVSDIASGIIATLGIKGFEIFNLCGDRLVSLKDVIDTSSKILCRTPRVAEANPASASIRNLSNSKIKNRVSWQPKFNLELGLRSL